MNRSIKILTSICLLFMMTGCWNSKDIQNLAYVTAIGLDYADGKYITYVQVLNFSNVGRSENMEIGKSIPVWIGRGEGITISESLSSIYSTSQMRMFWGHVKAVICSESILKRGVRDAFDALNRYREIRYNIYIYGTRHKLTDIFVQKSLFNLSPLDTIMFTPEQIYSQRSSILPLTGNRFFSQINEPGEPAMLPSISIDDEVWREDFKDKPMLKIDGAYFFRGSKMAARLTEQELVGTRWTQKKLRRSMIHVPLSGPTIAALVLTHPKYKIKVRVENDKVYYDLTLRIKGALDELVENRTMKEIELKGEALIRQEIVDSFRRGLAKKVDVLQLEEHLYRNLPNKWHELRKKNEFLLNQECLGNIDVHIHILSTGKYKLEKD